MKNVKQCSEKLLGLDIGTKKVGLAWAGIDSFIPKEIGTFLRAGKEAENKIIELINKYEIRCIVVGIPLLTDNKESPQSGRIKQFVKRIVARTDGIKIVFQDEYLSSEDAKDRLIDRGIILTEQKNKSRLDSVAACIILERYLETLAK